MKNLTRIESIQIQDIPAGSRGFILHTDSIGKHYVKWDSGCLGVVQERGESYKLIEKKVAITKNLFWKLKRFFLSLRNIK